MKKTILTIAVTGALAISFTGCMGGKEVVPMTIQTNSSKSISLNANYQDTISNKEVTLKEFKKGIEDTLERDSKYKKLEYKKCNEYRYCSMQGRKVDIDSNKINLYYLKGLGYKSKNSKNEKEYLGTFDINSKDNVRSLAHFKIPYSISEDKNSFKLNASFPKSFGNLEYGELGLANYPQLDKTENLKADALRTFNNLNNVTVSRTYTIRDEVNSKYDKKSIEANFKRLVHRFKVVGFIAKDFVNSLDKKEFYKISRENPYMIKYKNVLYPIRYEVFDYRGGSKVKYSLDLKYNLNSDKTATLTKADLEALKKEIENIVND